MGCRACLLALKMAMFRPDVEGVPGSSVLRTSTGACRSTTSGCSDNGKRPVVSEYPEGLSR